MTTTTNSRVHQAADVVRTAGRLHDQHLFRRRTHVRPVQHLVVHVVQKVPEQVRRLDGHVLERLDVLADGLQCPLQVLLLLTGRLERRAILLLLCKG